MKPYPPNPLTRRSALKLLLLTPASALLAACGRALGLNYPTATANPTAPPATLPVLEPTPACDDGDDDPTPAQTEGPYYTPNTPQRTSFLEVGLPGIPLTLSGLALDPHCRPLARVLIDFWHCDSNGTYDNQGFTLRGHQLTDAAGRYSLETILPGLYPGRTRHIHVKVQAPDQPVLTTQLYFPEEPENSRDRLYDSRLLVTLNSDPNAMTASFNFVLPA